MSIVVDTGNASQTTGSSVSSVTFSSTVQAGATLLLVMVTGEAGASPYGTFSATYNGSAMTAIGSQLNNNDDQIQTFYMVNPPSGTHNVVVSFTKTLNGVAATAISMAGTDVSTIFGTTVLTSSDQGPNSPFSHAITTTGSNSVIFDNASADRSINALAPGGSQTQIGSSQQLAQVTQGVSYRAAATATSYTDTWTSSGPATQFRSQLIEVLVGGTTWTKNLTESITVTDSIVRSITRPLTQAITVTDTFIRSVVRTLTEAITNSDVVTEIRGKYATLTDSILMTDVFSGLKVTPKALSEAVTVTDTFIRSTIRSLVESITVTDTYSPIMTKVLTFTESITVTDKIKILYNGLTVIWHTLKSISAPTWSTIKNISSGIWTPKDQS